MNLEEMKKLPIYKPKGHEDFEAIRFCFGHVALDVYRKNDRIL